MTSTPVTAYRAAWVLPVTAPPIPDGTVLVDGAGQIAAVGPTAAIDLPSSATRVDLGEAALLPGLINVHGHAELSVFRGFLEDLPFHDWILRLVGAKRAHLGEDDLLTAARWTVIEALRAGITTLACTESSTAAFSALAEAGMRGVVYQETFGPDPARAPASMDALRQTVAALRPRETELLRVGVSPHAPFTVSDRLYRETSAFALTEGLPVAVHIAESAAERALVVDGEGPFQPGLLARGIATAPRASSPIELLDRLGVLRTRPLLIHCVDLTPGDIQRIVDSGSPVAHCPIANAKLGHGIAPVTRLLEAGATVALGTDSVGSNNRLDLLEEARTAALLQRAHLHRPDLLPPAELLRLCTLDGARALGLEGRTGALEPGLDADLCAVSLTGAHTRPVGDPLATLFHSARATDVVLTMVRGEVLFDGTAVRTVNEGTVRDAIDQIGARLRESP